MPTLMIGLVQLRIVNHCGRHGTFRLRVLIAGEIFSKLAAYFSVRRRRCPEVPA
jgi:hypothetical protein